ncbi:MAG: arsenate reductase (glutaredoxin) [Pseudomonadota bacterium]|nr:arsenate reductase (glutaredoxin) [Pseudomonadota bacterium]
MTTTIWHNPRCSKSRQTLALLEERGISPAVRLYLDDAPSTTEVAEVLCQLGIKPWELLRRGEKVFKELGLDKDAADEALIEAMSANPILIERPIVIHGGDVALGRPPESVMRLFD